MKEIPTYILVKLATVTYQGILLICFVFSFKCEQENSESLKTGHSSLGFDKDDYLI